MPNLTIKNLPREVHAGLKRRARKHRRSLNAEILEILEGAAPPPPLDVEKFLAGIREIHKRWKGPPITDEEVFAPRKEHRM